MTNSKHFEKSALVNFSETQIAEYCDRVEKRYEKLAEIDGFDSTINFCCDCTQVDFFSDDDDDNDSDRYEQARNEIYIEMCETENQQIKLSDLFVNDSEQLGQDSFICTDEQALFMYRDLGWDKYRTEDDDDYSQSGTMTDDEIRADYKGKLIPADDYITTFGGYEHCLAEVIHDIIDEFKIPLSEIKQAYIARKGNTEETWKDFCKEFDIK